MTRKLLPVLLLAIAASVASCGVGPGLTGNDSGGIINWTPEHQAVARQWAADHCARYGKVARMYPIYARYGEYISFTCEFPRGRYAR
jgi:hypothetical protein